MNDKLLIDRHAGGVTVLTINRPAARNALDLETMRAFASAVEELQSDSSMRVVVLTGAGEAAFCSGGDLVELSRYTAAEDACHMITLMGDALLRLERLPVPVIAAINGYALGGGSEIALACDLRIVDETVRMGFVQVKMALTPGWGAGQRLLRLVGYPRALELLLAGEVLNAPALHAAGLVNTVVERGAALPHALQLAERIAESPPDVVRGIKRLLQAGLTQTYDTALQSERDIFPPLWASPAHNEAVENFLNRERT